MERSKLFTVLITTAIILSLITLFAYNLTADPTSAEAPDTAAKPAPSLTPERPHINADDDPVQGSEDAPVTIIEFSDFECSFCARHYAQTMPLIEEQYIRSGKVKLIFRDFPLDFHPYAKKAAEASECADEQGKYWEYHDKLFENQNELDSENLRQYAIDLELDGVAFNQCLDSGTMAPEVEKDILEGSSYGVRGTPTFFINGIRVVGAQPYAVFEQIIEQELDH